MFESTYKQKEYTGSSGLYNLNSQLEIERTSKKQTNGRTVNSKV